jgi:Na+-driven multidrug efflux pump
VIFAIGLGSGIGANALASRRFGERDIEATNRVAGQVFPLTAIFGIIFIIPSVSLPGRWPLYSGRRLKS